MAERTAGMEAGADTPTIAKAAVRTDGEPTGSASAEERFSSSLHAATWAANGAAARQRSAEGPIAEPDRFRLWSMRAVERAADDHLPCDAHLTSRQLPWPTRFTRRAQGDRHRGGCCRGSAGDLSIGKTPATGTAATAFARPSERQEAGSVARRLSRRRPSSPAGSPSGRARA